MSHKFTDGDGTTWVQKASRVNSEGKRIEVYEKDAPPVSYSGSGDSGEQILIVSICIFALLMLGIFVLKFLVGSLFDAISPPTKSGKIEYKYLEPTSERAIEFLLGRKPLIAAAGSDPSKQNGDDDLRSNKSARRPLEGAGTQNEAQPVPGLQSATLKVGQCMTYEAPVAYKINGVGNTMWDLSLAVMMPQGAFSWRKYLHHFGEPRESVMRVCALDRVKIGPVKILSRHAMHEVVGGAPLIFTLGECKWVIPTAKMWYGVDTQGDWRAAVTISRGGEEGMYLTNPDLAQWTSIVGTPVNVCAKHVPLILKGAFEYVSE